MVNPEILDYVKKELARGVSESQLRQVLLEHGWPEFEINEAFEKTKEEVPKETIAEKKPGEVKKEKSFKEFLEGLGKKEPKEEAKPKAEEKPPVMEDVKKIITNKVFIVAAVIIILGSVAFFVLPSLFGEVEEPEEAGAMAFAREECKKYCDSYLCGLFIDNTVFTHPELEGKSCMDLGFTCLLPDGQPKCETVY